MAITLIGDNSSDTTDLGDISFTSGIDSTYKLYIFNFFDINPATDAQNFLFQVNASGESGYNEAITSTAFRQYHSESDSSAYGYDTGLDQDNDDLAFQVLAESLGNGADESCSGQLYLFNPAGSLVKHFYANTSINAANDYHFNYFIAGYINTTTAITAIQFKVASGNLDGLIKFYGVG